MASSFSPAMFPSLKNLLNASFSPLSSVAYRYIVSNSFSVIIPFRVTLLVGLLVFGESPVVNCSHNLLDEVLIDGGNLYMFNCGSEGRVVFFPISKRFQMAEVKPIKILVVGSEGSGKGYLLRRIATPFSDASEIGMRFFTTTLDGQPLRFWEWVGTDNPHSPKPEFYEGASGACVVYDVRSLHSFEQAKLWTWVLQADYKINSVLLFANYCQDKANRLILPEDGRYLAEWKNLLYFEADAGQAVEIEESFRMLVQHIVVIASY